MLKIPRHVLERVSEEARLAYARDEESCGFLAGPADSDAVDTIVPMVNRASKLHALDPVLYPRTARTYFDIDPLRFAREVNARQAAAHPVKVLYHSHLDVGAYFSDTDAAAALGSESGGESGGGAEPTYRELVYLVTSVTGLGVQDQKLFAWCPASRTFAEAPFEVTEPT